MDEQDGWRNTEPRDPNNPTNILSWWPVSLRSDGRTGSAAIDDTRRQAWLNLDNNFEGFSVSPAGTNYTDWCPDDEGSLEQNTDNLYASIGPIILPDHTLAQNPQANLSIGGVISGTLGIRGGDKIYYVTEDLEVPAGETLRIRASTTLVFSPGQRMVVKGQLFASGNTVFPIRFISPDPAGWQGIHFEDSAVGSWCSGCYLENIQRGGTALQVEAPLSFQSSLIRDVPGGTAISSTVPLTLSHVVIDHVSTGIRLSGQPTATHTLTHLTLNLCQQGVVNHGQTLALDNSILTMCGAAISTELSGTTVISYTLFDNNAQDFATEDGSQLIQGPGLLNASPGFVDFPYNVTLRPDSLAVDAADPQADYSGEWGYNGGRADLGAYGNTWRAPEQPPLDQMSITLEANYSVLTGKPGKIVSYTLTLENSGSVTDTYSLSVISNDPRFGSTLVENTNTAYQFYTLAPQEKISATVWVNIPLTTTLNISSTILATAVGRYKVRDEVELTVFVESFHEDEGQVVMEAEHFALGLDRTGQTWLTQTVLADYTGPGYVSALPDIDRRYTPAYTTTSPELQYTINFTTVATYYVWLRGYTPNAAGDSLYVGLDDQSITAITGFAPQEWDWATGVMGIEVTEPGLHTLHIWQREDGLRLDRILLTTDNTFTPTGNGPAESEVR